MRLLAYRLVCTALLASPLGALAASTSATPLPPPVPAETRQFDFWLGEWNVTKPDGKPAGTNRIESVSGGRALLENWTGDPAAGNGTGKSLNAWNADKQQWQQFWVGSGGGVLELAGGLDAAGSMVLCGEHEVGGRRTIERITWTPMADSSVRQLWEQSADGGQTWSVAFDGHYVKNAPKAAASRSGGGGGGGTLRWMYFSFW